jgi:hypothetical protein
MFFYHAPLEHIANPQQTPMDTKAPWYFWWLQGMLKLGDKTLMGIIIPTLIVGLLVAVPYIDRNPYRRLYKRPVAVGIGLLAILTLVALSYMGTPLYGIQTSPAQRIMQDLAPEEGLGPLRSVPFDQLEAGVYEVGDTVPRDICPDLDFGCPEFTRVFGEFSNRVNQAAVDERLPEELRLVDPKATMVVEDWQTDLKKITMRVDWTDVVNQSDKSYERHVFLHRHHGEE